MKKKLVLVAAFVAVAALVSLPTQAYAADYTSPLTSNTAAPGAAVTYSAATGEPDIPGTAYLYGDQSGGSITPALLSATGNFTTSSTGQVNLVVKLPSTATNGSSYSLSVTAGTFSDTQTITAAAITPSAPVLSFTGFNAMPYLWFGGALVLLGVGVIIVLAIVRRSRKTTIKT